MKKFLIFFIFITLSCSMTEVKYVSVGATDNTESGKLMGTNNVILKIDNISLMKDNDVVFTRSLGMHISVTCGSDDFVEILPFTGMEAENYTSVRLIVDSIEFTTYSGTPVKMGFPTSIVLDAPGELNLRDLETDSVKIAVFLNLSEAIDFNTGMFKGFKNNISFVLFP